MEVTKWGICIAATEIQNIQIGEGDVCRARDIPLYMVLPRLFTCPTTSTPHFKIGTSRYTRHVNTSLLSITVCAFYFQNSS